MGNPALIPRNDDEPNKPEPSNNELNEVIGAWAGVSAEVVAVSVLLEEATTASSPSSVSFRF